MIAIITLLAAFPLGYTLRSRLAANLAYAVAYLWAFVFQTLYLLLDALAESSSAPAYEVGSFPWGYGVVALSIFLVGFALVRLGGRVRERRVVQVAV